MDKKIREMGMFLYKRAYVNTCFLLILVPMRVIVTELFWITYNHRVQNNTFLFQVQELTRG